VTTHPRSTPTIRKIKVPVIHIAKKSSEHLEQVALIQWTNLMSNRWPILHWFFAIPNGAALPRRKGSGFSLQGMKLKQEGLKPGVCDLMLPSPCGGYNGFFLELKYGKNKPSEEQIEFIEAVRKEGYYAAVCWGADAAIEELEKYLSGETRRFVTETNHP
jgi:hypothetical protein